MKATLITFFAIIPAAYCFSQRDTLVRDTTLLKIVTTELKQDENWRGYYEFVGYAKGSKDDLFLKAKQVIYRTYNSGSAVIKIEDKESGLLDCRGRTQTYYTKYALFERDMGRFTYKLTVQTKDGRYRLIFSDFTYEKGDLMLDGGADIAEIFPHNWKARYPKEKKEEFWAGVKKVADAEIKSIMLSFDSGLNSKTKQSNDRW